MTNGTELKKTVSFLFITYKLFLPWDLSNISAVLSWTYVWWKLYYVR